MVNLLSVELVQGKMIEGSKTEQQLGDEGWTLASSSSGQHLKRTLDMYHELGIETYLYKVDASNCRDCTKCFVETGEPLFRIYIKPSK
jgi:hypothetical protein